MTKPADVTGGKKTMKRRQQIRELIEHHDVANEEEMDFFNATPGRTNKNKVCNFSNAKLRRLKFLMHEMGLLVVLGIGRRSKQVKGFTPALKPRSDITRNPKHGTSGPTKKDIS